MRNWFWASLLVAAFSLPLGAQTFSCAETIDSMVAHSDAVYVGHVMTTREQNSDIYGHVWTDVDLKVQKTIRGKSASLVRINLSSRVRVHINDPSRHYIRGEVPASSQTLLIVVKTTNGETRWPQLADFIDLDAPDLAVWSADFVMLHRRDAIVQAAEEEAKRIKADPASSALVCIDKPVGDYAGTSLSDIMSRGLMVPSDKRMEERAHRILTGEIKTPYGEDSQYWALKDLGTCKSATNITYLRGFLHDQDTRLRWAAYEALQQLGQPVTPPEDKAH